MEKQGTSSTSEDHGLDGESRYTLEKEEEDGAVADVDGDAETEELSLGGKIFRSVVVYASYFAVALSLGILGPSLTDLGHLISSTVSEVSLVFVCRGLLAIIGSLVLGPVLDKVDRYLLVGLALVIDFFLYAVVPWCSTLPLLLIALSPPEFCNCVIGMGTHLICIGIWGDDSEPSLQFLNLIGVLGFMTAPLLVKPFLMPSNQTFADNGNLTTKQTNMSHTLGLRNLNAPRNHYNQTINQSRFRQEIEIRQDPHFWQHVTSRKLLMSSSETMTSPDDIITVYVFVVVAIYSLVVGVLMLGIYFYDVSRAASSAKRGKANASKSFEECKPSTQAETTGNAPAVGKTFVVKISLLYFIFNFFYGGIEIGYAGLVSTFAVKYLGWSTDDGSEVTAVVQGANAALTAVAVVLSRCIKPQTFVTSNVLAVIASLGLLCLLVEYDPIWLWICTAMLGASYASIMPSSISWVNSFMVVDGKFSSAYWAGFFCGFMAIPGLTGYLFNLCHPMWFPYCMLISAIAMGAVYLFLCLVVHCGTKTNNLSAALYREENV